MTHLLLLLSLSLLLLLLLLILSEHCFSLLQSQVNVVPLHSTDASAWTGRGECWKWDFQVCCLSCKGTRHIPRWCREKCPKLDQAAGPSSCCHPAGTLVAVAVPDVSWCRRVSHAAAHLNLTYVYKYNNIWWLVSIVGCTCRGCSPVRQLEYTVVVGSKQVTRMVLWILVIALDFINVIIFSSYIWMKGVCFTVLFTFQFVRSLNSEQFILWDLNSSCL